MRLGDDKMLKRRNDCPLNISYLSYERAALQYPKYLPSLNGNGPHRLLLFVLDASIAYGAPLQRSALWGVTPQVAMEVLEQGRHTSHTVVGKI